MGWSFGWSSKESVVKAALSLATGYKVLDHSIRGNTLYSLIETPTGEKTIGVSLLSCRGGEWGYKGMSESCGPRVVDCPKKYLDASTCQDAYAVEWRKACRDAVENKKAAAKLVESLKAGDVVSHRGKLITYVRHYSKSQIVATDNASGKMYRYPIKELKAA